MIRTLLASALSVALVLGVLAPRPAQANSDDLKKILGGIATVIILGATYDHLRDRGKRHEEPQRRPGRGHGYKAHGGVVPSHCLREVETRHGGYRFLGKRCLERSMRAAHRLPQSCQIRVQGRNGHRIGYGPGCLRDHGWRLG